MLTITITYCRRWNFKRPDHVTTFMILLLFYIADDDWIWFNVELKCINQYLPPDEISCFTNPVLCDWSWIIFLIKTLPLIFRIRLDLSLSHVRFTEVTSKCHNIEKGWKVLRPSSPHKWKAFKILVSDNKPLLYYS